jgi:Tfp pilus assembly protein PilX
MLNVPAFASLRRGKGCFRSSRHSPPATRHSQRGVALIITLILLSVVTFMAITFLALSRRERSAVTTVTDTAGARLAADAALANAEAQIIANVLSTTNPYNFSLLVSTNYINPVRF